MRPLLLAAFVFFVIAALGAFTANSHINQFGFLALGLASFSADMLVGSHAFGLNRSVGRPARRRSLRTYL